MRSIRIALSICALAIAGCATNPKPVTATACTTPAACDESPYKLGRLDPAPPRSDCPEGYQPATATLCINDLPIPVTACLRAGCTPSETYRRDFRDGYAFWDCPTPSVQSETALAQRGVGVCKPRKVALSGPPGEVLSLSLREGPEQRSYYYYRRGQDGVQYICPFKGRKRCEEEGVPKDQECADYSQCLEVCLDAEHNVIW